MTFTVSVGIVLLVLGIAFVLGLLSPLFLLVFFVWGADV